MNENKQAEPVSMIQCFGSESKEILRIEQSGDVIWNGRKVESDAEFKAAMIDLSNVLRRNILPAPAVVVDGIYRQTLEKIATVNAMDYEYQRWAKAAIAAADAAKKGGV